MMALMPEWIKPGVKVTWLYQPQGVKELPVAVPAVVRKVTAARVTIEFQRAGERVLRVVLPRQLSPRT
jgi:hypothetical protein